MTKRATQVAIAVDAESRENHLRQMLEGRRREVMNDVQGRIRSVRNDATARPHDGMDQGEACEAHTQGEIAFSLIQMKAETLAKIDAALLRVDQGRAPFGLLGELQ